MCLLKSSTDDEVHSNLRPRTGISERACLHVKHCLQMKYLKAAQSCVDSPNENNAIASISERIPCPLLAFYLNRVSNTVLAKILKRVLSNVNTNFTMRL